MAGDDVFTDTENLDDPMGDQGDNDSNVQALNDQNTQLAEKVETLTSSLREATTALQSQAFPQQQQVAHTPQPPADPDELIRRFANDPQSVVAEISNSEIDQRMSNTLAPMMTTIIDSAHNSVVGGERARLDAEFGPGTFDEVIMPELANDFRRLSETNQTALASSETVRALVDRVQGQHRVLLNDREKAYKESADKGEQAIVTRVVNSLPPSALPRPKAGDAPTEEMKTFMGEVKSATGESVNEKAFIALHNAGSSLEDYLAATVTEEK